VFQFYNLIPSLTAIENVALVTDIAENPMKPADALALVGLSDRANHFPARLTRSFGSSLLRSPLKKLEPPLGGFPPLRRLCFCWRSPSPVRFLCVTTQFRLDNLALVGRPTQVPR
jgi:hypothetical protein